MRIRKEDWLLIGAIACFVIASVAITTSLIPILKG